MRAVGISAVVVSWNGRDYVEACIAALLCQDPPPDEVLLADNHSDDGSRELVAERFPSVRILDTGANRGPGLARNVGVAAARHDRVLLVDNDVVLQPGALASLRRTLEAYPDAAMVQARSVCDDRPDIVHYDAADLHYLGLLVLHNWFVPLRDARDPDGPQGAAVALCVLVDRARYLQVGGFHEELFFFFEDTDLAWRLRMLGYTIRLDPSALCRHRGGTAGLSMRGAGAAVPPRRTYYHSRNRWLVLLTCLSWRSVVLLMPAQILYALVHLGLAVRLGHGGAWLRGKVDLLRMLPRVLSWRREVQPRRRVADRDLLVASPLTYNPGIAERGPALALRRALDRVFALHWRLVRWLCG